MHIRKHLNGEDLLLSIKKSFSKVKDHRSKNVVIRIEDALMSAFALFSLKYPSLLQFDKDRKKTKKSENLKAVFNISKVPSDTQMRQIIDSINPEHISTVFKDLFALLQRGKLLKQFSFVERRRHEHMYLVNVDGTGYFSSNDIKCSNCLVARSGTRGDLLYQHKMLAASIAHPSLNVVIPLAPEPIIKQDGETKNDCEQNAFKRFLKNFRAAHPKLQVIFNLDALYANTVVIKNLERHNASYIISVKEDGHKALFKYVEGSEDRGNVRIFEETESIGIKVKKTIYKKYRYKIKCHLNQKSVETKTLVNFLEYWEETVNDATGEITQKRHFTWVTNLQLKRDSVKKIVQGGRSRWKIENETFNTLKNSGYNFEHNYGHGHENLSTNLALIMMLVFLFDQIQEMSSKGFRKALKSLNTKYIFWQEMRYIFKRIKLTSWSHLIEELFDGDKEIENTS